MKIHDETACELGEGPLWHPERNQLFWFDILEMRLHTTGRTVQFDEHVSAAGWIDRDRLLVASETRLFLFDLETEAQTHVIDLEADTPGTRSNDGRADPQGGFWIGTMSKAQPRKRVGTIYRYHRGDLRPLFPDLYIPNGIAFSPDGTAAYFADTMQGKVWRTRLDAQGWPKGDPEIFLDHSETGLNADGAVTDAEGNYWSAEWGSSRVACYDPSGTFRHAISFGAPHTSCPAFGGPDLTDLYCTSANENLTPEQRADGRPHGATFVQEGAGQGAPEHRVIL